MGDVVLLRQTPRTSGGWIEFVGGPFDGQQRLMGAGMSVIALPGTCPPEPLSRWESDPENGITHRIFSTHKDDCECPEEWKGMQEYRVQQGRAHYVGRRPNPETEDDEAEVPPKLWTPADGVPKD